MTIAVNIASSGVLNLLRDMEKLKLLSLSVPADKDDDWFENDGDCPLCALYHEPNEETIAAFEEGDAMERGEIPANRYKSVDEIWEELDL